ncbi:MAG: hypothetical protein HZA67_02285 [Rhodospirillales bacterium]|nr:hypothetical protein [Rhodospirillales bacterium]
MDRDNEGRPEAADSLRPYLSQDDGLARVRAILARAGGVNDNRANTAPITINVFLAPQQRIASGLKLRRLLAKSSRPLSAIRLGKGRTAP